jgi:hypothetical protein
MLLRCGGRIKRAARGCINRRDRFWEGFRGGVATIELINAADLEVAWTISLDFPDQDFSLIDRTSFAVMLRLGIHRAAAFDDDFAVFRFGRNRDLAFEITC